jgi:two-component system, cell cycle sensor histidine kinase and response regulator CckA
MTSSKGPLVLVVDDESPIRQMERRILEKGGYRTMEASGGEEAIAMLSAINPDLLIADLDMPGLAGEEMVRRIHVVRPHLKVLYVTAHIDRLLDAQSIIWDGEAFLDKPFTAAGLIEAVTLLLTGSLSATPQTIANGRTR